MTTTTLQSLLPIFQRRFGGCVCCSVSNLLSKVFVFVSFRFPALFFSVSFPVVPRFCWFFGRFWKKFQEKEETAVFWGCFGGDGFVACFGGCFFKHVSLDVCWVFHWVFIDVFGIVWGFLAFVLFVVMLVFVAYHLSWCFGLFLC